MGYGAHYLLSYSIRILLFINMQAELGNIHQQIVSRRFRRHPSYPFHINENLTDAVADRPIHLFE